MRLRPCSPAFIRYNVLNEPRVRRLESRRAMKESIVAKLAQLSRRLEEINQLLSAENAPADMGHYRKLAREHAEIAPVVKLYDAYRSGEADIRTAQEMSGDPTMRDFAESEIRETRERLAKIEAD